jgi:hypothetical protein
MPVTKEIEIVSTPETPCPECGDVLENLIGVVQDCIDAGRDGFFSSQCKACKGVFKAQTKLVRHLDAVKMKPVYKSEKEKQTGIREKALAPGELPPNAPRPAEQEAIRLAIKEAKKKPKQKRSKK